MRKLVSSLMIIVLCFVFPYAFMEDSEWICPQCGRVNTSTFCKQCGVIRPGATPIPSEILSSDETTKNDSSAIYSAYDVFSSMSDDELLLVLNKARAEIQSRNHNPENIISQADGMTIYLTGLGTKERNNGKFTLYLEATCINSGNKPIGISIEKASINGWDVDTYETVNLNPGKKKKINFSVENVSQQAEIMSTEEIVDIGFYSHSYNPETYSRLTENIYMTVILK